MNKNQKLYAYLALYFAEELHNKADEPITEMQMEQKKNRDSLLDKLAKILLNYTIIDSDMSLTLGERANLNSQLGKIIDKSISGELKSETSILKEVLSNTCLEKYSTNNYIYNLGTDFKLTRLDAKKLGKIMDVKIDGEMWADRIRKNKSKIAKDLKVQINKFLKGEINVNEIKKIIQTKYNMNATNTNRLVRTEVARCQSEANEEWAKEHSIEQQLFSATLDGRTSSICQNLDGTVWNIDDADKPTPPRHPNCRSCLINIVSKDWRPEKRIDNITKENINYTTYNEWNQEP